MNRKTRLDWEARQTLLAWLIAATGASLWLYAGWSLVRGRQPLAAVTREPPRWNPLVVIVTLTYTVYATARPLVQTLAGGTESPRRTVTLEGVQNSCVLSLVTVVILAALLMVRRDARLSDYGIHTRHWARELAIGLFGFLASLLPVYIVLTCTLPWRNEENQHVFLKFLKAHPDASTIGWVSLAVVVLAPMAEELQYRVVLQGWLRSVLPAKIAIPLVAVVFSVVHGFPDSLPLLPLALVLGYVFEQRGSYLSVVSMHALFNAWNLVISVASSTNSEEPTISLLPL